MKTKNQTDDSLFELAVNKAANEDGFTPPTTREVVNGRKQQWSPREVWRTRVKAQAPFTRNEPA